MRDITTTFDWFLTQFLRIVGSTLDILLSFRIHGVSILEFILAVGLIGFGLETVISIHKDDEHARIKKIRSKKKGAN